MKELRINLMDEKGQKNTFVEENVPMQKLIDCLALQDSFEKKKIKSNVEGATRKIEFVASCFKDERVTPEAILKGLDARKFEEVIEGIINQVLGIDPESKKSETEKL